MKSTPVQSYAIRLTLDNPIDFAFSPRLSTEIPKYLNEWY